MTIIFPKNNLPESAQPWAREVQKQLANVITSDRANEINNSARDNQLNSSLISLTTAVNSANNALNGLIGLGSTGSSYNINAENITVGTLSGVAVFTSSGSRGATLYDAKLSFDWNSSQTGYIQSFVESGTTIFEMQTNIGSSVVLSNGSVYLGANYGAQGLSVTSAGITLAGNLNASGYTVSASTISAGGPVIDANGYKASGVSQAIIGPGGGVYPTNGTQTGTANVIQSGSSEILRRVSSARKYKLDIQDVDYGLKALNLRPRTWIDKTLFEENQNSMDGLARIPGFVAEEVYEAGLDEFVIFNKEGEVESLHYDRMLGSVISILKYQQEKIENLTTKLEILENGA